MANAARSQRIPYQEVTIDEGKLRRDLITRRGGHADIEVDGGVDASNAGRLVAAGASILVAGAAVFHAADCAAAIKGLRRAAEGA